MKLVGANPSPKVAGEAVLSGKVNYLIGKDPKKWRTNIPTFGKVHYEAVYPGIDLVYYGNQRQMEYDFVVAPGADPNQIRLSFSGLIPSPQPSPTQGEGAKNDESVRISDNGDLVVATDVGDVRMKKPILYQEIAGVRVPVDGGYHLLPPSGLPPLPAGEGWGEGKRAAPHVSFQIAAYDRTRPLIIDPVLVYSTYLGGTGHDHGYGIAVDATGAAYVMGTTRSEDFPTTVGAFGTAFGGSSDIFVTKLDPSGSALSYSTYLGGSENDTGYGIVVDGSGAAYVTGTTYSEDFPTTVGAFDTSYGGGILSIAFVTKLDPTGVALVYSTYLGGDSSGSGSSAHIGIGIAVDGTGAAYVTGTTYAGGSFPTTVGAFDIDYNGDSDAFVTKLDPAGTTLVYSTFLGGSSSDDASDVVVERVPLT
jgi:hypothetical protein